MDDKNIRIKQLREILGITQDEFGKLIGIKKSGVCDIESGRRQVTEQHIRLLASSDYCISENWLRTGNGGIYNLIPAEDEYFKAVTQLSSSNDKLAMQAIINYWKLDESSKKTIRSFFYKLTETGKE